MSSFRKRRMRMAAIDFLNPAPLMWDFEYGLERGRLLERYEITYTSPAECARRLATGEADLGLVPAAAYAGNPDLLVVPGCTIASLDWVRSILLVTRAGDGPGAHENGSAGIPRIGRVASDTSSMTSHAYMRILFERLWKQRVEFVPHPPDLDRMLAQADAAMLIGDPALVALEARKQREERTGERLLYIDLAHVWRTFAEVPWVSAFWAVRADALVETGVTSQVLIEDLEKSREHGLAHIDELAEQWSRRIPLSPAAIREYLTENIHYVLDKDCMRGLEIFYRFAVETRVLPPAPQLKFL